MLHGFQEPTMPTGSELRLTALGILSMTHQQTTPMPDSPSERQESPAGHPNARLSPQRGRSHQQATPMLDSPHRPEEESTTQQK